MRQIATMLCLSLVIAACGSTARDQSTPLPMEEPGVEAQRLYAEAGRAFEEKRYDDAADLYEEVYETWPASRLAPDAEFNAAESLYRDGKLRASFVALKRFLELHALYGRIDRVEKRLFELGVRQIDEGESGLLGLGIFPTSEEGVETLEYLTVQFPTGEYADDALMAVGRYRRKVHDLEDARVSFKTLLDRYPDSEWRFQARLLLASTHRELNRGVPYDPGTLRDARREYAAYIQAVEADPARATEYASRLDLARRRIREIDERLGSQELLAARWYIHLDEEDAAAFYLTRAATLYASTDAGQEAAGLLRGMGRDVPEAGARSTPAGEDPADPTSGSR